MCQGARSGDGARRDGSAVAVAQHDGQGNQAHRDHSGRHNTRSRRQQGTDQNDRNGHTAAHRSKDLTNGFEQVFGHT